MTGHTSGKWVAREQENSFTIGQEHDGGKLIAETAPFFIHIGAAAKERARADAELIANAPEMDARIKELEQQRDELLAALHDAATSLETIQLRSFGADSCLDDKHSMRAYAGSRAAIAREAMVKSKGAAK